MNKRSKYIILSLLFFLPIKCFASEREGKRSSDEQRVLQVQGIQNIKALATELLDGVRHNKMIESCDKLPSLQQKKPAVDKKEELSVGNKIELLYKWCASSSLAQQMLDFPDLLPSSATGWSDLKIFQGSPPRPSASLLQHLIDRMPSATSLWENAYLSFLMAKPLHAPEEIAARQDKIAAFLHHPLLEKKEEYTQNLQSITNEIFAFEINKEHYYKLLFPYIRKVFNPDISHCSSRKINAYALCEAIIKWVLLLIPFIQLLKETTKLHILKNQSELSMKALHEEVVRITTLILVFIFSIYVDTMDEIKRKKDMDLLNDHFRKWQELIYLTKQLREAIENDPTLKQLFASDLVHIDRLLERKHANHEVNELIKYLSKEEAISDYFPFFSLSGSKLRNSFLLDQHKEVFSDLLLGVGQLLTYMNLADLVTKNKFSFVKVEKTKQLQFDLKQVRNLMLREEGLVANDFLLSADESLYVIIDPNAGGKSMAMMSLIQSAWLAHTLGIAPCAENSRISFIRHFFIHKEPKEDAALGKSLFTSGDSKIRLSLYLAQEGR